MTLILTCDTVTHHATHLTHGQQI